MFTAAAWSQHQAASAVQPRQPREVAALICSLMRFSQSYHALCIAAELSRGLTHREGAPESHADHWTQVAEVRQCQ